MKVNVTHNLPSMKDIKSFRSKIMHWFNDNGRDYPWRQTNDPFRVLIAEMMLRRTKADQVEKVYNRLFNEYPGINDMAHAKGKKLDQILYPLGLKWRTPTFRLVARELMSRYQGKVPDGREELIMLPGVGDYVAGAVMSIAYEKAEWIVDSNIVRLFRRYFGIKTSREGRRDKHVIEMAKMYASGTDPRRANLAILDFAALICIPKAPKCEECTLIEECRTGNAEKGCENAK